MNVNLGATFDKFIGELLKSGAYQSQSEVVREGLRLAQLRKEIAIGSLQADRGEFVDGKAAFARIRHRSNQRKRRQAVGSRSIT